MAKLVTYWSTVQQHPTGAMREHILQVCNTKLAECATKEKEQREKHAETGTAYEQKGSAFISTVPLLRKATAGSVCQNQPLMFVMLQRTCV